MEVSDFFMSTLTNHFVNLNDTDQIASPLIKLSPLSMIIDILDITGTEPMIQNHKKLKLLICTKTKENLK